ncbi:MAG: OmpH family outer membrane protein [bacterium]|nr:OmpH family outer membrane protein [bacterium]
MRILNFRTWVLLGTFLGLLAPVSDAAAEVKIGFVDQQRAVMSSTAGKEAEKTLTGLQKAKMDEVNPLREECKRMQEELEAQKFVLSKEVLQERGIEFQRCTRDLERSVQAAQDELSIQERKYMAPLIKQLEESVRSIGKKNKFDLILDRSSPGVLYFPDALDITDLVIKQLNGG